MKTYCVAKAEEMKKGSRKIICSSPQGEISGYFCLLDGEFLAL
jgi:hypothetical protein